MKYLKYAWVTLGVLSLLFVLIYAQDYFVKPNEGDIKNLPYFISFVGISISFLVWLPVRFLKSKLKKK